LLSLYGDYMTPRNQDYVQLTLPFLAEAIKTPVLDNTTKTKKQEEKIKITSHPAIVDEVIGGKEVVEHLKTDEAQAWEWTMDVEKWIWKQIRDRNIPEQDREDVYNLCVIEVFHLMKRYNPKYSKVSWANFGILKALKEYESTSGVVRLPFHVLEKMANLRKYIAGQGKAASDITIEEMQAVTKMKPADILVAKERYAAVHSTDSEGNNVDFSNRTLNVSPSSIEYAQSGSMNPEENMVVEDQLSFFYANLEVLSDLEIFILVLRYGLDTSRVPTRESFSGKYSFSGYGNGACLKTQDISDILGVSRERVRQIELKSIETIKKKIDI